MDFEVFLKIDPFRLMIKQIADIFYKIVNLAVVPESVDASLSKTFKITHFASVETFQAIKPKGSNSGLRCA